MTRDRSRSSRRTPLQGIHEPKLVHITKCAGKALEDWGFERGYAWGRHWKRIKEAWSKGLVAPHENCMKSEPWHLPPSLFLQSPYEGFEVFTVVRDPYERAISEFRCPWKGYQAPTGSSQERKAQRAAATAAQLNVWLQKKLRGGAARQPFRNGHLIPQHLYLVDGCGARLIPERNVLRMECLDGAFAELVSRYGLTPAPLRRANESSMPRFTIWDLTAETCRLVESEYAEDFDLLGYPRLTLDGQDGKGPREEEGREERNSTLLSGFRNLREHFSLAFAYWF
mmetsp:Transcript_9958/g.20609  ORF Transcript_9958/g.20609 Transcript_9958/m.20609 type:complete len:283 (-) Transcript_9958:3-851(-)